MLWRFAQAGPGAHFANVGYDELERVQLLIVFVEQRCSMKVLEEVVEEVVLVARESELEAAGAEHQPRDLPHQLALLRRDDGDA